VQQDLLGLITAAGGGLSARDLAELTSSDPYEIEEILRTVAGRSFTRLARYWQPSAVQPVYVLGHEELQKQASAALEPRLKGYREQLDRWAQDYRARGWPAETPEYLLRGYFRLLLDAADVAHLTSCVTDRARHDRMLDITGGDAVALIEITDVQNLLLRRGNYDLPVLARLNVHRTFLAARNAYVPVNLPSVWAALGHPDRAEALARSIIDPGRRAEALAGLVEVVADAGDLDRAQALAQEILDPDQQAQALTDLARAAADAGDLHRAQALADQARARSPLLPPQPPPASSPSWWPSPAPASRPSPPPPTAPPPPPLSPQQRRAQARAERARAAADAGNLKRAQALARKIPDLDQRAQALTDLMEMAVEAHDLDRARALARDIPDPDCCRSFRVSAAASLPVSVCMM
jgi:tetratricopeptide (TPR) repeat protein